MNYRSKALLNSARDEPCVACGQVTTTVWAHGNEQAFGKGTGIKGHDLLGLYLCVDCHRYYDGPIPQSQKRAFFREHYPRTMVRVAEKLVAGEILL